MRDEIVETTVRVAVLADRRDWDGLAEVFSPEVAVDYTSLVGGEPTVVGAKDLVQGWADGLGRLAVTQHLVTNHLVTVDGVDSVVTAAFQATHVPHPPDERRWVLGGDYRFTLRQGPDGWRITGITMTVRWETGDRTIMG
jgi:hypothetical protein